MGKLVQVILLIFGMTAVALGNTTVSGKIKDQSTGESIPSVAVVVEGR